jgi:hypothetical protein
VVGYSLQPITNEAEIEQIKPALSA